MGRIFPVLAMLFLSGCATSAVDRGEQLFSGCREVDVEATRRTGDYVCRDGETVREAFFGGNGRTCGTCHRPGDNFGLSVRSVEQLPRDHPLFVRVPGLEDPRKLRSDALIHVITSGIDEFRTSPKLTHLQKLCDESGRCTALGQLGDRTPDLCVFSIEAVQNHLTLDVERVPDRDFIAPTREQCDWLIAYMLSDRVAKPGR